MMISLNIVQKKARLEAGSGICTVFTQGVHDNVARTGKHCATNPLKA